MALATLNLTLGSDSRKFYMRPGTSDEGVFEQVLKNSEYNFRRLHHGAELMQLYDRIALSKAPLIVDAGANIGASPLYFALSFPKASVVAIEPERDNFELLAANSEGLRIECVRGALASKFGSIDLVDPGEGSWGFRVSTVGAGKTINQTVPCVTINDIYAFDPTVKVVLDDFTDIIGRHFRQPEEGLGYDNSPSAHMWRTIIAPTRFL